MSSPALLRAKAAACIWTCRFLTRCAKQSEKPAPTLQSCMFRPNSSRTRYARRRKPNLTFASALPTVCRLKTCLKSRKCCAAPKPNLSVPIHRALLRPAKHVWAFFRKTSIVRGVSASFRAHRPLPMKRSSKPTAPGWDNPRSSAWATTCSSALTLSKRSKSL